MKESNLKIDFVLPWVDGSDPDWQARFKEYSHIKEGDSSNIRFRDWDLLKYWFRAIENFAPWFNNIYFITSGELPDWLNIENTKLRWIQHKDFIPAEYLPTFSVRPIEMNLHRIKDLSETFVYFNDDSYLTKSIHPSRFFYKNSPCDSAIMTAKPASGGTIHVAINDLDVLDKHFDKHQVIKRNFSKWYSLKYKSRLISNILLYPWKEFSGFIDPHIPYAYVKSTLSKIWEAEPQLLDETSKRKFRTNNDVNQWLTRYWQLAEGNFHPKNIMEKTICLDINDDTCERICNDIRSQKYEIMCLNDSLNISDFEECKRQIKNSFECILPQKSSFEK
ncbi:MAG: Stealth CR1 domain-containing protein [Dysgonomonas sp.]